MKTAIIHFSDIHFKAQNNSIFDKQKTIIDALKNEILDIDSVFLVLSGDIAISGKDEEYEQAIKFFDEIKKSIQNYIKKSIKCLLIPGNHDCNYGTARNDVRDTIITSIQSEGCVKDGFVDTCCEVQSMFFDFREMCQDDGEIIYADKLLTVIKYLENDRKVFFYCYNTSWMSVKNDAPGKLFYPTELIPSSVYDENSDLAISVLHHPFSWQLKTNVRKLKKVIEDSSDIIFTGHEHVSSKYRIDDLEGNITEYIEGAVLQDTKDPENSGFNLVLIDLGQKKQKLLQYEWNGEIYSIKNKNVEWCIYERSEKLTKRTFQINNKFEEHLKDPGITFSHPRYPDLTLHDIFIWPSLRNLKIDKDDDKLAIAKPISSEELCGSATNYFRLLIVGSEKSGKSTFCKVAFHYLYNKGFVPILIDGDRIRKTSVEDIIKLTNKAFEEQYNDHLLEKYNQLDNEKKLIIIDGFDTAKLNLRYKAIFLDRLNNVYPNILLTANDFYTIEEIIYSKKSEKNVFESYRQYELIEFGHYLRSKIVDKWNNLGIEETIEDADLMRKNEETKSVLDIIIGKNFVPSYPFFLLIILQSIEIGTAHHLRESSFGYYYDFLVTQALGNINAKTEEIDAYFNYISELAFFLFKSKIRGIAIDPLQGFHDWYCDEYDIRPSLDVYMESLVSAKILKNINGVFKFRYKYLFYYFVAKYLANNISNESTKTIISGLCDKLHVEEFGNIIMFLTHQSKDNFIIDQVVSKASTIFSDFLPTKLEDDIEFINKLVEELPALIIEDKTPEQKREEDLKERDKYEFEESQMNDDDDDFDYEKTEPALDFLANLNTAYKSTEILGQILKNYYGSIKGERKIVLGEEAYFLGLRSLNFFYDLLSENYDFLIVKINEVIANEKLVDRDKIEEISKKIFFAFFDLISYSFIKKWSSSLGNENLKETYKKILERNDTVAINLIDIAIKLQFFYGFPHSELKKIRERFKGNMLAMHLLKRFVVDYLYMYPVNFKDKQKICSKLDISMRDQRYIEQKTTQRKR